MAETWVSNNVVAEHLRVSEVAAFAAMAKNAQPGVDRSCDLQTRDAENWVSLGRPKGAMIVKRDLE